MSGTGGGDERVIGGGFGRDVVVGGSSRSHSAVCGSWCGSGGCCGWTSGFGGCGLASDVFSRKLEATLLRQLLSNCVVGGCV